MNRSRFRVMAFHAAALAALTLLVGCSDDNPCSTCPGDYSASEPFEYALALGGQQRVELVGIHGSIDVAGWAEADSLRVWGTRRVVSASLADAQEHLADLEVEVLAGDEEVRVQTRQPQESGGRTYEVTYHLLVPRAMDVTVHNVNGGLEAENLAGDLAASLVNGSFALEGLSGNVLASSVNGSVTASLGVPAGGACRLSTVNGSIALRIPTGTSAQFSAQTSSGTITLQGLQFTDLATTGTSAEGTLGDGSGEITLQSVNGSILLQGR